VLLVESLLGELLQARSHAAGAGQIIGDYFRASQGPESELLTMRVVRKEPPGMDVRMDGYGLAGLVHQATELVGLQLARGHILREGGGVRARMQADPAVGVEVQEPEVVQRVAVRLDVRVRALAEE
jgi:hypothetical protein